MEPVTRVLVASNREQPHHGEGGDECNEGRGLAECHIVSHPLRHGSSFTVSTAGTHPAGPRLRSYSSAQGWCGCKTALLADGRCTVRPRTW
jgi:hypothetical protein